MHPRSFFQGPLPLLLFRLSGRGLGVTHRCSWGERWLDKYRDGRPGQKQIITRAGKRARWLAGFVPASQDLEAISPYFRGDYRNFRNGCLITKARAQTTGANYRAPATPPYYGVGFRAFCVKKTRVIILPPLLFLCLSGLEEPSRIPQTAVYRILHASIPHPFLLSLSLRPVQAGIEEDFCRMSQRESFPSRFYSRAENARLRNFARES